MSIFFGLTLLFKFLGRLTNMKEILFICECHYYRLAFKYSLEREKGYTIEFDTLGSLVGRYVGHKTALIHLTENNYTEIFLFFENNWLYFAENITFITNKRLITLLSRFFDKRLRFIDELSILGRDAELVLLYASLFG